MTSLCPGTLFQSSGLNHHSTPTAPTATPSEIDRKLIRQPFNGRDWPRDSPVARVYDITNSSTSLVLLNRRRKKKCQLRGLTVRNGEIVAPEPRRHLPEEPTVNWHHHKKCTVSTSEHFRPRVNLDLGWVNTTQRPPVRFDSGSHVNHRRHTSCRVSGDSPVVGWRGIPRRPATTTTSSAAGGVDSELRSMSPLLNDPDISQGGRRYLYSIARIYSTSHMKQLKQDQYHQLLFKELGKGYHSPKEYERYLNYLNTPRKTQYGKLDNYEEQRRSKSVPPHARSDNSGRGGESDRTPSRKQKRSSYSSQSWAPSMISSGSRPSTRQKAGDKKTQRQQSPLPLSPKPTTEDTQSRDRHSPVAESDDDATDHTRKEESEVGEEETLAGIKESDEDSIRSKDKTAKSDTTTTATQKETESTQLPLSTPPKDEDGVSPRKGEENGAVRSDAVSPRKGEEPPTPRKDDVDGQPVQEERSSVGAATSTTNAPPSTSSTTNTTSNNFLALIVSDAEKDDDSKTAEDSSEQEKQSSAAEENTAPTASSEQEPGMVRNFSDMQMASGHTPRMNKEGRTRPLSRAGRGTEQGAEKENSDDDYDDTDDETEKTTTKTTKDKEDSPSPPSPQTTEEKKEEPVQRSALESEPQAMDTSRTDDSKTEERGEAEDEPTTAVDPDRRATTPEEGRDERAKDSREAEGSRSMIIPVSQQAQDSGAAEKDNVRDLSAEDKNRDVDKLEY